MSKIDAYSVCNRILSKNRLANYKIDYILVKNENNTTKYQAYTTRKSDPDRMLRIEFNNEDSYNSVEYLIGTIMLMVISLRI